MQRAVNSNENLNNPPSLEDEVIWEEEVETEISQASVETVPYVSDDITGDAENEGIIVGTDYRLYPHEFNAAIQMGHFTNDDGDFDHSGWYNATFMNTASHSEVISVIYL